MSVHTKDHYIRRQRAAERCFQEVAKKLGEKHPMTVMMGTLAWGRHHFERGPSDQGLKDVVYTAGALAGIYDSLVRWGLIYDQKAQRLLIDTWSNVMLEAQA